MGFNIGSSDRLEGLLSDIDNVICTPLIPPLSLSLSIYLSIYLSLSLSLYIYIYIYIAYSVGAVEYSDYISTSVLIMTLNNLMVWFQ